MTIFGQDYVSSIISKGANYINISFTSVLIRSNLTMLRTVVMHLNDTMKIHMKEALFFYVRLKWFLYNFCGNYHADLPLNLTASYF